MARCDAIGARLLGHKRPLARGAWFQKQGIPRPELGQTLYCHECASGGCLRLISKNNIPLFGKLRLYPATTQLQARIPGTDIIPEPQVTPTCSFSRENESR